MRSAGSALLPSEAAVSSPVKASRRCLWRRKRGQDRLRRSTRDVLNLVHDLKAKGAVLTVLEPAFSTKDATGSILVIVLGMVAEMERKFIRERQQAGIEAAKAKGGLQGPQAIHSGR